MERSGNKGDAIEIDGLVYQKHRWLALGSVVNRQIVDADDYDLWTD